MKFKLATLFLATLLCFGSSQTLRGQARQSQRSDAFAPAAQREKFKLQNGFVIELVASEEDGLINSIGISFDDAGR